MNKYNKNRLFNNNNNSNNNSRKYNSLLINLNKDNKFQPIYLIKLEKCLFLEMPENKLVKTHFYKIKHRLKLLIVYNKMNNNNNSKHKIFD